MLKSFSHPDEIMLQNGLTRFSQIWERQAGRLVSKRLEGALGRIIRCETSSELVRDILVERISVKISEVPLNTSPHAKIRMAAPDWARILTGELHIMAIVLAGRAPFPKDQRRLIMQFSMLLQTTLLTERRPV